MRVLVACEFSGIVRDAFIARGHDVMSCDLLPTDRPGPHYQGDVMDIINDGWDMMIAHPPCTWLCQAQLTNSCRKDRPKITAIFHDEREKAFQFVLKLWNAPINKIAIENPFGYLNYHWHKSDQNIKPYQFGHPFKKPIHLWLKNLPILQPTVALYPIGPYKKLDYYSTKRNPGGRSLKSITFQGIADAMAAQWGETDRVLKGGRG